jgi:hypothetical protein
MRWYSTDLLRQPVGVQRRESAGHGVARVFLETEEVRGSDPLAPTSEVAGQRPDCECTAESQDRLTSRKAANRPQSVGEAIVSEDEGSAQGTAGLLRDASRKIRQAGDLLDKVVPRSATDNPPTEDLKYLIRQYGLVVLALREFEDKLARRTEVFS